MNYQKRLEEEINNLTYRPKLLLHVCCGPCSTYVLDYLNKYFDISVYFYNPNIDTYEENALRVYEAQRVIDELKIDVKFINAPYKPEVFEELSKGMEEEKEGGKRCIKCFYERLDASFLYAKENGFDYITTSLTISPYKNAEVINNLGKNLSEKYQFKYLYSDFKKKDGYKKSIEFSKKFNLYRQDYCGCKFSRIEMENKNENRTNNSTSA